MGNREVRSAKLVADHLAALGFDDVRSGLPFKSKVTTRFNGQTTGVMHACGHDAHTGILVGVAEALASMKAQLPGEILFIFQPAEEGPPDGEKGGTDEMLAQGLFKRFKAEAVFGLHVWSPLNAGQGGYLSGPMMAALERFNIVVKGRQTHGSRPWGGVDPIVAAAVVLGSAQTIVSRRLNISQQPAVVSFGAIHGGIRYSIIPADVELIGTNHPTLAARASESLAKAVGAKNVVGMDLIMGAEDFSYCANQAPGFFFMVGSTPRGQDAGKAPSNHSPEFFMDEGALKVGIRAILQVALDYQGLAP